MASLEMSGAPRAALVTGAARGIGRAAAERLLADGWRVALLDILEETLAQTAAELSAAHQAGDGAEAVLTLPCDVADSAAVGAAVAEAAARFGRLDAVVNNAGLAIFGPILETTEADWRRVLDVNLTGPFLVTQAAAPHLIVAGGGAVVNITSISGLRASTLRVAYGTSKAGLAQLTLQQAVELGEHGIRVNAIAPGPTETAMATKVHTPEIRAAYHDALPLNRYGDQTEIASAIAFLLSDEARFITGQVLAVDGGFEATGIGLPGLRR